MDCEESASEHYLDIDLVKLRAGEVREFEHMYRKYVHRVYGYAFKISGSREDAEELTQEIFYTLWQQREAMRSEGLIWVVTRHKCIDYLRKARLPVIVVEEDQLPAQSMQADNTTMREEETQEVLAKLSAGERTVFALLMEGRSRQEIKELLHLPLGTIDSRLHRLKHKLQGEIFYGQ